MRITYYFFIMVMVIGLAGCSIFKPYEVPIQQGNLIEDKTVKQLQPGMTKAQVRYLLGTPNLVNPYGNHTWYYIYTIQKEHLPSAEYKLVVTFEDDKLASLAGNYIPPEEIQYTTYHSK